MHAKKIRSLSPGKLREYKSLLQVAIKELQNNYMPENETKILEYKKIIEDIKTHNENINTDSFIIEAEFFMRVEKERTKLTNKKR